MVSRRCSKLGYSECPENSAPGVLIQWNSGKLWEHLKYIQNAPGFPVSLTFPWDVPKVFPNFTKSVHRVRNFQDILNIPIQNISGTPFWFILSFTDQEHYDRIAGYITKYVPSEPLGNTAGTFFGEIQDIPINYLIRTSQSHDLVHFECTGRFLWMSHSGKLQVLSLGKFRMFPSIT